MTIKKMRRKGRCMIQDNVEEEDVAFKLSLRRRANTWTTLNQYGHTSSIFGWILFQPHIGQNKLSIR